MTELEDPNLENPESETLEDLIHYTYTDLFELGFKEYRRFVSKDLLNMRKDLPSTVIDKMTMDLIELDELFKTIDYTKTCAGTKVLYRSLLQPPTSLELIRAKQDSVIELEKNAELRSKTRDYLLSLAEKEDDMLYYFFREWERPFRGTPYEEYRNTQVFFERMVEGIKDIPSPQTPYLQTLTDDIMSIEDTRSYDLIKGPVSLTGRGLKHIGEVGTLTPKIMFTVRRIKPTIFGSALLTSLLSALTLYAGPESDFLFTVSGANIIISIGTLMLGTIITESFDRNVFMKPLRDTYRVNGAIRTGIEAVGKIDELLSFYDYSRTLGEHVTMPLVTDDRPHYFVAEKANNPILMSTKNIAEYTSVRGPRLIECGGCGECDECMEYDIGFEEGFEETLEITSLKEPFCIPNDIDLSGQYVTILTGPNSGGKTTYAKTISQIQLLAQIGCYVPAKEAELSIADRMFYQAPMFDSLRNPEGRFGTELARTRDIFFRTTPHSLVVLDDSLAGATTHEETIQTSYDILDGFHRIGNNTLLITHNTELAQKMHEEDRGKYMQVEFRDGAPTYIVLPGISEHSHSDVVSKKIGFSRGHIQQHLKNQKYIE